MKFEFRKNADWTSTKNELFPFTTASHSYHQDWQKCTTDKSDAPEFIETIKSGKLPPLGDNKTGIDYINKS